MQSLFVNLSNLSIIQINIVQCNIKNSNGVTNDYLYLMELLIPIQTSNLSNDPLGFYQINLLEIKDVFRKSLLYPFAYIAPKE